MFNQSNEVRDRDIPENGRISFHLFLCWAKHWKKRKQVKWIGIEMLPPSSYQVEEDVEDKE